MLEQKRLGNAAGISHNLVTVTSGGHMSKPDPRERKQTLGATWRLQDAKARFSEVVKRAREDGPQRVTLHGKDAVVIIAAEAYDRDRAHHTGRRLVEALAASPLREIEFERAFVTGPVRDVEL